ncbi:PR domain zinc finger protein 2 [Fundulus heteroclitus]|uniref:PR domain zinc finger protein 2 n=1 Tax=Fundulus heteroclitus TaxID=8078 RepID=UPI00165ACF6D|nr:PR domain zinc finger protein 2 [Fundulus heteroclitus]XP_035992100.1 PR domain zinc finger protein 2 [Fundulus heteroclitus]
MDDSSHSYASELGDREETQAQLHISREHIYSHRLPVNAADQDAFVCRLCHRSFTCKQGLEQHTHLRHPCESLQEVSTTSTNDQHQEGRIHDNQLQPAGKEYAKLPQEEIPQELPCDSFQQQTKKTFSTAVLESNEKQGARYMLDVSSNISENLSFYIDGKILSTSTVENCEMEIRSGSSALVGLDALIVGQVLNADADMPGQQQSKRRTATPPLLPQIKAELPSGVVVSSSSLIENLFLQNAESAIVQEEHTVFLSPKLKQLLEKQEGFQPTVALITDEQKAPSPVSLPVLPSGTGKFRRRTSSPTGSPQQVLAANEEAGEPDPLDLGEGSKRQIEGQRRSPVQQTGLENNDTTQSAAGPEGSPVVSESWAPATGGNPCNQRPLDLSNTVKRNEDVALADAALDLSLQRKSPGEPEPLYMGPDSSVVEKVLIRSGGQKVGQVNPDTPVDLLQDLTLVTGSHVLSSLEHVAEGLVYGLPLPSNSLASLEPSAPCAIAFSSPVTHAVLPSAPSLITVLAPPPSISSPSSQPIQVLGPNISPEPLVICTENALNSSQCDLATAFAAANSANIVALSQPFDPTLNLPSHVFLTEQIALNPPLGESAPVSEVPFPSTVTLNDSLLDIASNTVLIECTIALETPGSVVPAAVTLQENPAEPPPLTQMVINHTEQQQVTSLPEPQTVDRVVPASSIAEPVTMTPDSPVGPDSPPVDDSRPGPEPVVSAEPPTGQVEEAPERSVSGPETAPKSSPPPPPPDTAEEELSDDAAADAEEQTFTKNFICNVCHKLFHSMKELGHHVAEHADEWPYKCEFCVLLFGKPSALLDHRSSLHGVGKTYVCSLCAKEFVYLCNLKQHQSELHPGQQCSYTEDEKGKLRPQNYNNTVKVSTDPADARSPEESKRPVKKEESEADAAADELFTTIKIMTSEGGKIKGPDVRLGINQHYPSFKPPPFPYHNRSPAGSLASATNFTTHNIPQTFSTAIRCTKCGKSFDNMPELHKHILACANASDKKRYTPRKNPVPLRHFAKTQNGVLSTTNSANGLNTAVRVSRSKPGQESPVRIKILNKRKKKFVQRIMPHRNKSIPAANKLSPAQVEIFVCPHCSREFTMRRSRTKHMAVCPRKPKEMKKRKEGGISVTKENNEHSFRGASHLKGKLQAPPRHNTRLQTSGSTKRPAILPVQTVFSSKRSKIIIKESIQPKPEAPALAEVPIRTFNPSMRQYGRVQTSVKRIPIKITIVKPPQKDGRPASQVQDAAAGAIASCPERKTSA